MIENSDIVTFISKILMFISYVSHNVCSLLRLEAYVMVIV